MTPKAKTFAQNLQRVWHHRTGPWRRQDRPQPAVQLPTEIWLNILSFLDIQALQRVCSVSRVFLSALNDIKYEKVSLRTAYTDPNLEPLRQLGSAHIREKVRDIHILLLFMGPVSNHSSHPASCRGGKHHKTSPDQNSLAAFCIQCGMVFRYTEFFEQLACVLPLLSHWDVFQLDVRRISIPSSTRFDSLWTSIGSRARRIVLFGNWSSFIALFNPGLVLPSLTDLSLFLGWGYDMDSILHLSIIPFLERHTKQLVALDLVVETHGIDLSPLFHLRFPRLHTFRFETFFRDTLTSPGSSLLAFLGKRHPTLQHVLLGIGVRHDPPEYERTLLIDCMGAFHDGLAFPNLTSLSIFVSREGFPSFVRILGRALDTLKELKILKMIMDNHEVEEVILTMRRRMLRRLQLTVLNLDLRALELVCVTAELESATILFSRYTPINNVPPLQGATLIRLGVGSCKGYSWSNEEILAICRPLFPDTIVSTAAPDQNDERIR